MRGHGSEQRAVWQQARPWTTVRWDLISTAGALCSWASVETRRLDCSPETHGRRARVPEEEMPWVERVPSLCWQSPEGQQGHQRAEMGITPVLGAKRSSVLRMGLAFPQDRLRFTVG